MSKETDRLKGLANQIKKPSPARKTASKKAAAPANPAHGEKGEFVKATITLSPEVYTKIIGEVTRRKLAKEGNAQISAVVREAVTEYLP